MEPLGTPNQALSSLGPFPQSQKVRGFHGHPWSTEGRPAGRKRDSGSCGSYRGEAGPRASSALGTRPTAGRQQLGFLSEKHTCPKASLAGLGSPERRPRALPATSDIQGWGPACVGRPARVGWLCQAALTAGGSQASPFPKPGPHPFVPWVARPARRQSPT